MGLVVTGAVFFAGERHSGLARRGNKSQGNLWDPGTERV